MRICVGIICALGLAACSADETAAPVENAALTEPDLPAEDVGLFEITGDNGATTFNRRAADGTFADLVEGEEVGSGTWRRNDEGQMCFGRVQGDAEESCWTDSAPRDDGSWMSIGPNGDTVSVRRIEDMDIEG